MYKSLAVVALVMNSSASEIMDKLEKRLEDRMQAKIDKLERRMEKKLDTLMDKIGNNLDMQIDGESAGSEDNTEDAEIPLTATPAPPELGSK